METIENNKLIAEFMGWTEDFDLITHTSDKWWTDPKTHKYHTEWSWLMPVVQKCYKIDNEEGFDNLVDAVSTLDFDAMYQGVVEFIKKYNEENQNNMKTREYLIEFIVEYSSDEIKTKHDALKLAKMSIQELIANVQSIKNYYLENFNKVI